MSSSISSKRNDSSVIQRLNNALEEGYEAKLTQEGRIYYVNHKSHTSSWLPPRENWTDNSGLPYGWETGVDSNDKPYFINHVDKFTTREDPRDDPDYIEPPQPREVELIRDPDKGFGFVAGSERPVVVRFVTEAGPSVEKLMPGDLILKINGEEVRRAPREKVIELVRSCKQSIVLTVCQPYSDSSRKSAILTAAKKAKLKNNPSRVRFADNILVDGTSVASQQSPQESYVPFMPNVLKVFLENGQTKSFKYDNKTTVKDVIHSLQDKLSISCSLHFSLVLQNMKSNTPGKMTLLQDSITLAELAAKPGARHFRCLFRVAYVPRDAYDLLKEDPVAFEYFYLQCCNDVIHERFASEMKYDTALRLAALQIQQHAMSNNLGGKISIKAIEKETGLDKFVSHSLMDTMKGKELRRMVSQYLKMNQNLTAPGQKQLTALQAKLHYLKIVSELKTFGSRVFMVTLLDQKTEAMVLVGPKAGISVVTNIKSYTLSLLADFDQLESLKVTKDGDNMHRVDINVKSGNRIETIGLGLLTEDAQNFVAMVDGYYQIYVDREGQIVERTIGKNTSDPNVPPYKAQHEVLVSPWAYPEDLVSVMVRPEEEEGGGGEASERVIDLSIDPPDYEPNEEYLAGLKNELNGQKTTEVVIEPPPSISEPPDLSDIIALASPSKRPRTDNVAVGNYEEGITSFGSRSPPGHHLNHPHHHHHHHNLDDSNSSLNSSFSSQGASFKTVLTASGSSSRAESSIDLTTEYRPLTTTPSLPINLVTFHANNNNNNNNNNTNNHNFDSSNRDLAQAMKLQRNSYGDSSNNNSHTNHYNSKSPPSSPASSGTSKTSSEASVETADIGARKSLRQQQPSMNGGGEGAAAAGGSGSGGSGSGSGDGGGVAVMKMNGGLDLDSGDVDLDLGSTPHASPARMMAGKLSRNSSVESALHSFGLHSPDMVQGGDLDFHNPNDPSHASNEALARMADRTHKQRIYLDPDIIDLTLLPPPETPDDDSMLDFTEMSSFPPPVFSSSNSSLSSSLKDATASGPFPTQAIPQSSSSKPSRLERSASTGNCPDFLDSDIDSLIAQFIIPPPPSSLSSSSNNNNNNNNATDDFTDGNPQSFANSFSSTMPLHSTISNPDTSGSTTNHVLNNSSEIDMSEFSHLIIPPPPSTTMPLSNHSDENKTDGNADRNNKLSVQNNNSLSAGKLRSSGRHKRSSSLDLASIKMANSQWEFDASNRCKSMEANKSGGMENSRISDSGKDSSSVDSIGKSSVGESPASVSEKLHTLLKSLPNFGTPLPRHGSDNDLVRTGSLRIHRSSSLDLNPQPSSSPPVPKSDTTTNNKYNTPPPPPPPPPTTSVSLKAKLSESVPNFSRSSSLRIKRLSAQNLSQSMDISTSSSARHILERSNSETLVSTTPSKTGSEKDLNKTSSSSGSESFASLKAKLKDYRDLLLNRNKSSSSKKYALDEKGKEKEKEKSPHDSTDSGKGSLRLTNSFRLKSPFGRRGSKSSEDGKDQLSPSINHAGNWELKEASPRSPTTTNEEDANSATTTTNAGESGEKKIPVVRDALGLNRPTLRPVSNTVLSQVSNSNHEEKEEEDKEDDEEDEEEEVKARKNGPLKALQSVFGGGGDQQETQQRKDGGGMGSPHSKHKTTSSSPSQHHHHPQHHQQQQLNYSHHQYNPRPSRHSNRTQFKDDMSMAASQTKEKMKANPYATIKMWRPTSVDNSASFTGDPNEELYQTFTNFDALRNQETSSPVPMSNGSSNKKNAPFLTLNDIDPVTGRVPSPSRHSQPQQRNHHHQQQQQQQQQQQSNRRPAQPPPAVPPPSSPPPPPPPTPGGKSSPKHIMTNGKATANHSTSSTNHNNHNHNHQRQDRPSQAPSDKRKSSSSSSSPTKMNGVIDIPRDYPSDSDASSSHSSHPPAPRKVSFQDEIGIGSKPDTPLTNGMTSKQSKSVSFNTPSSSSSLSSSLKSHNNTPSSSSSSPSRHHHSSSQHSSSSSPPPPPLPNSAPPPSPKRHLAPSVSDSNSSSSHYQNSHDTSFSLVSDGATNSVKLVLSHKYDETSVDTASKDIERLLAELKFTMDSLTKSRIDKNPTQLAMCLSELHTQTKNFIQEAKHFVSSANNSKVKLMSQLERAVHALAHLFLHGQACMLMMEQTHQAQHLGFHFIKAANAFKTTVSAANAASGRSLNDPQMKYLMRQATNLANLLAALLSAVKQISSKAS